MTVAFKERTDPAADAAIRLALAPTRGTAGKVGHFSKYVEPEKLPTIYMAQRHFSMVDSGDDFATKVIKEGNVEKRVNLENLAVSRSVQYTDLVSGKAYFWEAYAFVEDTRIRRFLYLNGALHNAIEFCYTHASNGLFSHCSDPKHAVAWALAHAEGLTAVMTRGEWGK